MPSARSATQRRLGVQVIRQSDRNNLYFGIIEEIIYALVDAMGTVTLGKFARPLLVDIANPDEPCSRQTVVRICVTLPPRPAPTTAAPTCSIAPPRVSTHGEQSSEVAFPLPWRIVVNPHTFVKYILNRQNFTL